MKQIEEILKESLIDLNGMNYSPFSKQGFDEYKEQISKFIIRLYDESIRNSKKSKSDVINKQHINDAVNYFSKINKFRFSDFLNLIGGLFLGSTISFVITTINSSISFSTETIIIHISLGIIGSFILGYNLSKE